MSDDIARGNLMSRGTAGPAFGQAWRERYERPDAWMQALAVTKQKFRAETQAVAGRNGNLRTDRERAAAAVRNISTQAPAYSGPRMRAVGNLSDGDFNKWVQDQAAHQPRGGGRR